MATLAGTKTTFFFENRGYGFTESYYRIGAPTDFVSETTLTTKLLTYRLKCAGKQTNVTFARIIDIANKRRGFTYRPATGGAGNPNKDSDAPTTAALIKRYNQDNSKTSSWFMRGNWDEACDAGGAISTVSNWNSSTLQPFLAVLVSDHWCWLAKDPLSPVPSPVVTITSNPGGQLTITTANNTFAGVVVGSRVKVSISGVLGADTANGVWVVTVNAPNQVTTVRQILINPYVANTGRLVFNSPALQQIYEANIQRFVERKPGRPLYHSRGRSRARKVTW
jgi:hypothetical protein